MAFCYRKKVVQVDRSQAFEIELAIFWLDENTGKLTYAVSQYRFKQKFAVCCFTWKSSVVLEFVMVQLQLL